MFRLWACLLLVVSQEVQATPGWILQVAYYDKDDSQIHVLTLGGEQYPKVFPSKATCLKAMEKAEKGLPPEMAEHVQRCVQVEAEDYQHAEGSTELSRRDLKEQA